MRIDLTRMQVSAVAAMLRDELADDERAYLDTLEGETDLYELVRRLLNEIEADEGAQSALTAQIEERQARKQRAAERIKANRTAIMALMESAKVDRLTLPEATVSLRSNPPKPIVIDEASVPDVFCKFRRSPDMAAIRAELESGGAVSGVSFDNGGTSLTVRRK